MSVCVCMRVRTCVTDVCVRACVRAYVYNVHVLMLCVSDVYFSFLIMHFENIGNILPYCNCHTYTFTITKCICHLLCLQSGLTGRPVLSHATVDYNLDKGRTMKICAIYLKFAAISCLAIERLCQQPI